MRKTTALVALIVIAVTLKKKQTSVNKATLTQCFEDEALHNFIR